VRLQHTPRYRTGWKRRERRGAMRDSERPLSGTADRAARRAMNNTAPPIAIATLSAFTPRSPNQGASRARSTSGSTASCPTSTPRLNDSSAVGSWLRRGAISRSALAKPKPWMRPKGKVMRQRLRASCRMGFRFRRRQSRARSRALDEGARGEYSQRGQRQCDRVREGEGAHCAPIANGRRRR
jgi:hypothetical protein